jgi:type II secretory pathway pseudopilin PulG
VCSIRRLRQESGISLIEILVALGILSAVLIALGGLMFQVARHTRTSAAVGYRSAAVTSAASWANGLAWDSIDGSVGCAADSSGLLAYTKCASVQTLTPRAKEISIVISPTGLLVLAPETVVVYRTKPRGASPFNVN